jgi:hypothetical protein
VTPVLVVLEMGAERYCLGFGGETRFKTSARGSVFGAENAEALAACPT